MEPAAYLEMARLQDEHWWFVGRRHILRRTIASLHLPPAARILEVGAGTGGNLRMLGAFGQVHAMEMDSFALQYAARLAPDADLREGSLPDVIPFPAASFDLICLFDVLEHVERDVEALRALRRLAGERGQLLLTVPAGQWLWSRHDERLHHHRRYSASTLSAAAREAGWFVNRLTHFNTLLFGLAVVGRYIDRLRRAETATMGSEAPAPIVNALLTRVFAAEAGLLFAANLPFGLSLMALLSPHGQHAEADAR